MNPLVLFFYGTLNGLGEQSRANLLLIPGIAVDLAVDLLLIHRCGIAGAAWGTFAGYAVAVLLLGRAIRFRLGRLEAPPETA